MRGLRNRTEPIAGTMCVFIILPYAESAPIVIIQIVISEMAIPIFPIQMEEISFGRKIMRIAVP